LRVQDPKSETSLKTRSLGITAELKPVAETLVSQVNFFIPWVGEDQ